MNPAQFDYPSSSTSVSGTSDLFSSTFAILSDTAPAYVEQQWVAQEKLQNGYYYDGHTGTETYANLTTYDPSAELRFDAYRAATVPTGYEAFNTVVSLPTVVSQQLPMTQLTFVDQTHLIRQPEPLHVYTQHLTQTSGAFHQPTPHSAIPTTSLPPPTAPSPMSSAAQRPTSSNTSTPSHNNNNQSSPQSDSIPEEVPLQATDCEDDERVMCMACRGVYPSRRSLTGHIGRNEKCREIIGFSQTAPACIHHAHLPQNGPPAGAPIPMDASHAPGRNYLEQVAAAGSGANASAIIPPPPGTESAKAGAIVNGTDGLSPICPYCDRFISHYKGNIRRHINQCGKTGGKRPKSSKGKEGKRRRDESTGDWSSPEHMSVGSVSSGMIDMYNGPVQCMSAMEIVQPPPIMAPVTAPPHPPPIQPVNVEPPPAVTPTSTMSSGGGLPSALVKKETEVPDDPYLCPFCDFLTVYKGNMKRHMNTCHVNEPDCKDHKLDKMKASVLGVDPATLMEKINAHKANSTRGRRPKKKDAPASAAPQPVMEMHQAIHQLPHMYQMSPPLMSMHHAHSLARMGHGINMTSMMDYEDIGCPADPYVYPPMGLIARPLPIGDDPSDPLQATINHVATIDPHRL